MTVVACLKWITPPDGDDRFGGVSPADQAALEWALRIGARWNEPVVALALGPPSADAALRDALACGAATVRRIDAPPCLDSVDVAAALASQITGLAASLTCCGDYSSDRGTGSVPAFVAARLDAQQALGLVALDVEADQLVALRRLDGGRRERLLVGRPAVISVEGGTAVLRRAGLGALLGAKSAPIDVVPGPTAHENEPRQTRPYRPRPRVQPAPHGATSLERIKDLLATGVAAPTHHEPVILDPPAAAERILAALNEWGYLP